MAIYHCSTKPLARSSGRSAVAAAAYRAGDCLTDLRQGLEHDYTRRSGVLYSELVLPAEAGEWSRSSLWNAAEQVEKRKDGRTAREWEVALPGELSDAQRRELAVRFARGLAARYGCAVDVALHAPDREGDQRNWHAHLLATTRKLTPTGLGEKCEIELSDAKRLSLGLAPARKEVEAVREMWANHVNVRMELAGQEERVDHRSLAAQRDEAARKNEPEKVAALDRAPQVKLGWKVIQMERRGEPSDRGDQLRQVKAGNQQRKAVVLDIGQLRDQLTQHQEADRQKVFRRIEEAFRGQSRGNQQSILEYWRSTATQPIPKVKDARVLWEQDSSDREAKAWQETRSTAEWETKQVDKAARAVQSWHREHPVKSLLLRTGIQKKPTGLQWLEQEHAKNIQFLKGSHKKLAELEQVWLKKQPEYEKKLEREGQHVEEVRGYLKAIEENPEQFKKICQREDQAFREKAQQREQERHRNRGRDHDRGGWSR